MPNWALFFQGLNLYTKIVCLRELRGFLFSLRNRLREHTLAILLPTQTTRHSWAIDNSMQHEPLLLTKHTNYADYADETMVGAYAKLRPAGKSLREHSCRSTSIIALTHLKNAAQFPEHTCPNDNNVPGRLRPGPRARGPKP